MTLDMLLGNAIPRKSKPVVDIDYKEIVVNERYELNLSQSLNCWKESNNKQSMVTSLAKDVILILARVFSNEEIGELTYYKIQEHFDSITYWSDDSGQYRVKGGRYLLELCLPVKVTVDLKEIEKEKNFYIKTVVDIDYTGLVENERLKIKMEKEKQRMRKYEDNPEVIIDTLASEVISELMNKHKTECLDLKASYELKYFFSSLIEELPDTGNYRYSNLERSIYIITPDKRTFLLSPFILVSTCGSTDSPKVKLSYRLKEILPMKNEQDVNPIKLLSNNTDFAKKYYLKSEEVRVKEEELEELTDDLDLLKTEALKLILENASFDRIEIHFNPLINVEEVFGDIRPFHLDEDLFILDPEDNSVIFPGSLKIDTRVETHKVLFTTTLTVNVTEFKFDLDNEPVNAVIESGYIDSVTFINDYFSITLDEILTRVVQTQ